MLEDEQSLIDAIAAGCPEAFESVYRAHKDRLLTAAVSLLRGDRIVGEEILHDAFIQLIEQAPTLRLHKSLGKYLMSCCLNRVRDHIRRQAVHRKTLDRSTERANSFVHPPAALEVQEEQNRMMQLLARLPDEQREVVTLHIQAEMSFQEIADAVGISVNTAKSRYRYALNKLREMGPTLNVEPGEE